MTVEEAAAPLLAASYNDDRVARRADDAWSRIKPEDPAKQPADVRVACGAFVRKGGRQQPLTLGKRSVEAPTPASKKLKTPISGVSGDARLSYALAEVGTQSSQDLTQEPRRRERRRLCFGELPDGPPAAWGRGSTRWPVARRHVCIRVDVTGVTLVGGPGGRHRASPHFSSVTDTSPSSQHSLHHFVFA